MGIAITAAQALLEEGVVEHPVLLIEDRRITAAGSREAVPVPPGWQVFDYPEAFLAPPYFDVHCHGSAGHDVMEDSEAGAAAMETFLARHGVGKYLPTTVTAAEDATLQALERLAARIERAEHTLGGQHGTGAQPVGIHLEGPFICPARRGVQPAEWIRQPDIALFERFYEASRGRIVLMTLAPEQSGGMELLRHCVARGVCVSMGHSGATAAQAHEAVAAGARSATHTFNAMRGMEHREPGLAGVVLAEDALYSELIADGQHVAPEVVRIWARAKPADRRLLVTDAISATGQGDGSYRLGPLEVEVTGDRCLHEGRLAGSVLTLDRAVANLVRWAGLSIAEAAAAAAANPAAMLDVSHGLRSGSEANFILLSAAGELQSIWRNGSRITA